MNTPKEAVKMLQDAIHKECVFRGINSPVIGEAVEAGVRKLDEQMQRQYDDQRAVMDKEIQDRQLAENERFEEGELPEGADVTPGDPIDPPVVSPDGSTEDSPDVGAGNETTSTSDSTTQPSGEHP